MGFSQAYGAADDAESITTLQRAIELGVTLWDTAQSYGAGHNERLLSKVLAARRDQVTLATKFGIVREPDGVKLDGRPERVRSYCDASLARLGVEHIDLYYLHRVDPNVQIEETIGAMGELVKLGKVRHLGVSECTPEELERAAAIHPITAVECEWSMWWREAEDDVVPTARRLGVGVVAYSPLGRGFLAGAVNTERLEPHDFRRRDARFQGEHLRCNRARLAELGRLAAAQGVTAGQLALAWLLARGEDVVPIPGTRHAARLGENARAVELELSPGDLDRLEALAARDAWSGDRDSFAAYGTRRTDKPQSQPSRSDRDVGRV
jgi:aryl-alcohol dehydrogenase-like predicted oxidoreductase